MDFLYRYFYAPSLLQKCLIFILLPISYIYMFIASLRRILSRSFFGSIDFNIPIVSVGNIVAGGSGKTPFIIELAIQLSTHGYNGIVIISRGYKRKSRGLVWVCKNGDICADVKSAGDEAFLIAKQTAFLHNVSVLVCEDRTLAINEAKNAGVKVVLLDDGFRFGFKKFDIILRPHIEPYYRFCLPSGLYRESSKLYETLEKESNTLILRDGLDFTREVEIVNTTQRMLLLSAIANPKRLEEFLPKEILSSIVGRVYFSDHSDFNKARINELIAQYNPHSLLVTQKDEVKLQDFGFNLSVMQLRLKIPYYAFMAIETYSRNYDKNRRITIIR